MSTTLWKPSRARAIPVDLPTALRLRGIASAIVPAWPEKSSADNFDFVIDPKLWLEDVNDHVLAAEVTIASPVLSTDLAAGWCTIIEGEVVVFLGGGMPGSKQVVLVKIATLLGRTRLMAVQLPITNESAATQPQPVPLLDSGIPVPPNAIQMGGNQILVAPDGRPYLIG